MITQRRVGVMGGTFDPIHCGHIDLGSAATDALHLAQLLVLPASVPPHRSSPAASSHHRFAMAAMAIAGREGWRVSDLELESHGPSYTTATLERLVASGYEAEELFFVIGADAFMDVESWMNYPALLDQAHFAVVSRPGHPVDSLRERLPRLARRMVHADHPRPSSTSIFLIDAPTADVSSTAIRRRRTEGKSIHGLVDPRVEQHIEQHGLYAPLPARPARGRSSPE